jgi:hypothetical protein
LRRRVGVFGEAEPDRKFRKLVNAWDTPTTDHFANGTIQQLVMPKQINVAFDSDGGPSFAACVSL